MKRARFYIYGLFAIVLVGCTVNILEEFGDQSSQAALIFEAEYQVNRGNFAQALTIIGQMSAASQARRDVKFLKASANAGLCGIDLLSLISALDAMGSSRLLVWALDTFKAGTVTSQVYCTEAQDALASIAVSGADRSADENLLGAFVGLAKMGTILAVNADTNGDGVADAGYDPCIVGSLASSDAKHLNTGLNFAVDSMRNLTSVGASLVSAITSGCTGPPAMPAEVTVCADPPDIDVVNIDATEESAMRSLVKESSFIGLGANCTGDITACNCP